MKLIDTKFGYVVCNEIPVGVSLRDADDFSVALVLIDKKSLDDHIADGGTKDNWHTSYVAVVATELDDNGKSCWNFLNEVDFTDASKNVAFEESGNINRGFPDIDTAVRFAISKAEQLLCPEESANK